MKWGSIMRLTMRTDLAMRLLMACAVNDGHIVRRAEVAEAANVSESHLAQVVPALAHAGFITTLRGRSGGIILARPAEEISIGAVFRFLESEVPFAECFAAEGNSCPLITTCRLRGALSTALDAFYGALNDITLRDLTDDNHGLAEILTVGTARVKQVALSPSSAAACARGMG